MATRDGSVYYVKVLPSTTPGVEGERIDVSEIVTSFRFIDDEKKADALKLSVDNYDLSQFSAEHWKKGSILEVQWGYPGRLAQARQCVINKTSGWNPLQIEANAKSILMDRELRNRTFENMTRSQIVAKIAKENGYEGDSQHIEETKTVYEVVTQARLSDAQFLRSIANKEGFEFFVDFDGLHWHSRNLGQKPLRKLVYFSDPGRGEVLGISVDGDIMKRPTSVTMRGRDPIERQDIEARSDNASTSGRASLGEVMEQVDARTGQSLGTTVINTAHDETLPTTETSEAGAQQQADGRFKRAQSGAIKLNIKIEGDPLIVAKSVVELEGAGDKMSGNYYVSVVEHDLGAGKPFTMTLKTRRDSTSRGAGSSLGVDPTTAGSTNDQEAKENPEEPIAVEVIDPRTGQSQGTQYRTNAGREST